MGEHTFGLPARLLSAARAVTHLSVWFGDMPDGYASGLEYDPDHSIILLDRSHPDDQLLDELQFQVGELLKADRENSRAMLRPADELEAQPPPARSDRGPLYRRQASAGSCATARPMDAP